MLDLKIQAVATDNAGAESPSGIRERIKGAFPPGGARRMTTLGLLVGNVLAQLRPAEGDAVVYASAYAESGALEGFIDSFPTPSPTLFQTSIQPSAVQQLLISRQLPIGEFLPLSGGPLLGFHALRAAFLSHAPRVLLCGGEERGTWLLEHGLASDRTFAFAVALTGVGGGAGIGTVRLARAEGRGELGAAALFDLFHRRSPFSGWVAPGWRLELEWS
jgi:hypothetical protein